MSDKPDSGLPDPPIRSHDFVKILSHFFTPVSSNDRSPWQKEPVMSNPFPRARTRRAGLTLVELVIVVAILAVLAGLIIPKLGQTKSKSKAASAAATIQETSNNIQIYSHTTNRGFPQHVDSLVTTGGSVSLYAKLHKNLKAQLTAEELTDLELASLTGWGFQYVMDHDPASTDAPNSAVVERDLALGTEKTMAAVNADSKIALSIYPDTDGDGVANAPAGERLIAVGIGPKNDMVGKTMVQAPAMSLVSKKTGQVLYNRAIALIAVYDTADYPKFGHFKGVVSAWGAPADEHIGDYLEP